MLLECFNNAVDAVLGLIVFDLHVLDLVLSLFEYLEDAALFVLGVDALQFGDEIGDLIAKLSEILGADAVKGRVGEIRDLLLCRSAVLHYHAGVCYIDLRGEVLDHFLLLIGERGIVENCCVRSFCRSVGGSLGCCCGSVILGVECEFYLKCFVHVIHIYISLANV